MKGLLRLANKCANGKILRERMERLNIGRSLYDGVQSMSALF